MWNPFQSEKSRRAAEERNIRERSIEFAKSVAALQVKIERMEAQIQEKEREGQIAFRAGNRAKAIHAYQTKTSLEVTLKKLRMQLAELSTLQVSIEAAKFTTDSLDAVDEGHRLYRSIIGRERFDIELTDKHVEGIGDCESISEEHHGAFSAPITGLMMHSKVLDDDEILQQVADDISFKSRNEHAGASMLESDFLFSGPVFTDEDIRALPSVQSLPPLPTPSSYTPPSSQPKIRSSRPLLL